MHTERTTSTPSPLRLFPTEAAAKLPCPGTSRALPGDTSIVRDVCLAGPERGLETNSGLTADFVNPIDCQANSNPQGTRTPDQIAPNIRVVPNSFSRVRAHHGLFGSSRSFRLASISASILTGVARDRAMIFSGSSVLLHLGSWSEFEFRKPETVSVFVQWTSGTADAGGSSTGTGAGFGKNPQAKGVRLEVPTPAEHQRQE